MNLTIFLLATLSLRAELQFSGYYTTPNNGHYLVQDTATGNSSGWLNLGQSFAGYVLDSFDKEHETLVLLKESQVLRLRLRESKVKHGKFTITGAISLGTDEKIEGVRATLYLDEEVVFPLKEGASLHLKVQRRPDGNLIYHSRFAVRQEDGTTKIIGSPTVIARPGDSFGVQSGELGYRFTP